MFMCAICNSAFGNDKEVSHQKALIMVANVVNHVDITAIDLKLFTYDCGCVYVCVCVCVHT